MISISFYTIPSVYPSQYKIEKTHLYDASFPSLRFIGISHVRFVHSRCHIVNQFNEGLYDIVIAADEVALADPSETKVKRKSKK